jgi:hypothetical protein
MTSRARGLKGSPKGANRATCEESSNTLSYNLEIIYFTKTNSTMSDVKVQLPKVDGNPSSDYGLWLCRLEAILGAKGLVHTIQTRTREQSQRKARRLMLLTQRFRSVKHPQSSSTVLLINPCGFFAHIANISSR